MNSQSALCAAHAAPTTSPLSFGLGKTAIAAGIGAATLKQWSQRGYGVLCAERQGDVDAKGTGNHCKFSLCAVLGVGVATELRRLGFPPELGLRAALRFTGFPTLARDGKIIRNFSQPFPTGETFLIARHDGEGLILNLGVDPLNELSIFESMDCSQSDFNICDPDGPMSVIVVNVGRIYHQVRARLGLGPIDLAQELINRREF